MKLLEQIESKFNITIPSLLCPFAISIIRYDSRLARFRNFAAGSVATRNLPCWGSHGVVGCYCASVVLILCKGGEYRSNDTIWKGPNDTRRSESSCRFLMFKKP